MQHNYGRFCTTYFNLNIFYTKYVMIRLVIIIQIICVSGVCFFWYRLTWVVPDKGP